VPQTRRLRSVQRIGHDVIMKTIRVRGVVGSENESLAWDVYVDLCLDDDDKIVDYQQVEFGAAPPPPTGEHKLIFFHGGQKHEEHGHIERVEYLTVRSKMKSCLHSWFNKSDRIFTPSPMERTPGRSPNQRS
jgi:hypothetical protein